MHLNAAHNKCSGLEPADRASAGSCDHRSECDSDDLGRTV